MSLFTELYTLTKERRFAMLVSSDHDAGLLTISVMPRALTEADGQYCKNLTLTASPEDFDSDFVTAINGYRSKVIPLLEQVKEAGAAIDKAAQNVKAASTKPAGKSGTKTSFMPPKPDCGNTSVEDEAKAYREASSGGSEEEEELSNDWMKSRQPELF